MARTSSLVERFVLTVDIQSYSSRNTRQQLLAQREVIGILDEAAADVGAARERWERETTGDGELAVIPPDVDMPLVVGPFVTRLNELLAEHNDDHAEGAHLRLRVAMHIDSLVPSAYSFAGPAFNVVSRLVDSKPVRAALVECARHDGVELALIVSAPVYRKVVLSGLSGIRPRRYREVRVQIESKGFYETAYLYVPGLDVNALDLGLDDPGPVPQPPSPGAHPTEPPPEPVPTGSTPGSAPAGPAPATVSQVYNVGRIGDQAEVGTINLHASGPS